MRKLFDQIVMHAGKIVKRHPGPKQFRHDTMFLLWVLKNIKEVFARQTAVSSGHMTLVLTHANGAEVRAGLVKHVLSATFSG
jgi:hypothetical protein